MACKRATPGRLLSHYGMEAIVEDAHLCGGSNILAVQVRQPVSDFLTLKVRADHPVTT